MNLAGRLGARLHRARNRMLAPWFGAVTGIRTTENVMAITFDDGPNPRVTPELLALFERHGARATHFMVGSLAARWPELVADVLRHGHSVAGHSFDHPSMVRLDAAERGRQIERGRTALGPAAAPLFRPPYGHFDLPTARSIRRAGLVPVTWTRHCLDWEAHDQAFLAARLRAAMAPGAIVLLHEGIYTTEHDAAVNDRRPMLAALEEVLAESRGTWSFVTVPELLLRGRPRKVLQDKRGTDEVAAAQRPGEVLLLAGGVVGDGVAEAEGVAATAPGRAPAVAPAAPEAASSGAVAPGAVSSGAVAPGAVSSGAVAPGAAPGAVARTRKRRAPSR